MADIWSYITDLKCSEINTIPSLAAKADTIDSFVKNPLVAEMFNIAGKIRGK